MVWEVNGVIGGSSASGTITTSGLYTAPSVTPSPAIVVVNAVSLKTPAAGAVTVVSLGTGPAYYVASTGNDSNSGSIGSPRRNSGSAIASYYARSNIFENNIVNATSQGLFLTASRIRNRIP